MFVAVTGAGAGAGAAGVTGAVAAAVNGAADVAAAEAVAAAAPVRVEEDGWVATLVVDRHRRLLSAILDFASSLPRTVCLSGTPAPSPVVAKQTDNIFLSHILSSKTKFILLYILFLGIKLVPFLYLLK